MGRSWPGRLHDFRSVPTRQLCGSDECYQGVWGARALLDGFCKEALWYQGPVHQFGGGEKLGYRPAPGQLQCEGQEERGHFVWPLRARWSLGRGTLRRPSFSATNPPRRQSDRGLGSAYKESSGEV